MCGLVGFVRPGGLAPDNAPRLIDAMADALAHRGPDDRGIWVDMAAGVAMGHRRLSIIDLSAAAHQPMIGDRDQYVLAFNGEIYNHGVLREELERSSAPRWRGHSDTETLLAGILVWGLEGTLRRAEGMFALALWDREARQLWLARDRLGEKPLYYGWQNDVFMFASELKALRIHPAFRSEIDRDALASYMRTGYVEAPRSIFRDMRKLMPGTFLSLPVQTFQCSLREPQSYWNLREISVAGRAHPFRGSEGEAVDALQGHLERAVRQQSIADVPLGAFLSGGIDSSTIVAIMQAQSSRPVRTFTIGFNEAAYQEAHHARAVARHLGTDHTELLVDAHTAMQVIPRLPEIYDEPFGDSSAIPTFLVAQLARQQVTVSLSGDGGDELFAGYTRYERTARMWRNLRRIPFSLRAAMAHAISMTVGGSSSSSARRAQRLAAYLRSKRSADCYRVQTSQRLDERDFVRGSGTSGTEDLAIPESFAQGDPHDLMKYVDQLSYLPDDILTKVDRASMAVSLEARVPLLDHRLVEFAWSLPFHLQVRDGRRKWILRQLLRRFLPESLFERPKQGFAVPVGEWIRGPLRDWAEEQLAERSLQHGLLDTSRVREQWARHLRGDRLGGEAMWHVLMFQSWMRTVTAT